MAKVVLLCPLEIAGVKHEIGEVVDLDERNLKSLLRRNAVRPERPAPKKAKKADKKTEPAAEK